jgi:hypothetical protein
MSNYLEGSSASAGGSSTAPPLNYPGSRTIADSGGAENRLRGLSVQQQQESQQMSRS